MADPASAPVDDQSFPVRWPFPGDELLRWELGHPEQGLPLRSDLMRVECGACTRRMAMHGGPREVQRIEQFHGYGYIYEEYADSEAVKRWRENPPESFLAGAKNPLATWRERLLPPIQRVLERLEGADFDAISWRELQGHLEEAVTLYEEATLLSGATPWKHDLPRRFVDLDRELFGAEHLPVALDLLRGPDCLFLRMVDDLVDLQGRARDLPEVGSALRAATPEALRLLDQSVAGGVFKRAASAFLDKHGRRFEFREYQHLREPSWRDDPAPLLVLLRGDLSHLGRDPEAASAQQSKAREEAEASVRAELESFAPPQRAEYWERLRVAREALVVREDYDVWMHRSMAGLRAVLLAFARRLTRTARIEAADDLWWLRLEELLRAPYSITDWDRIVACRKAEWARWSTVTPPRILGAVPEAAAASEAPPQPHHPAPEDPSGRRPPQLSGITASRGTVQGRARMLHSWDDVPRVEPGDIVVTGRMHHMSGSLALVLTRAAGFITESESPLEGFAMVARHLDIPAVVGCRHATRLVEDGQLITLDGDAGTVRLRGDGGPGPLEDWFDNIGTSDESTPWAADVDGYGWSLSAQALKEAGVAPGGVVTVDGIAFRWPEAGPGSCNNVVSAGQVLLLPAQPGATRIGILGFSSQGSCTGQGEIGYADGSTERFTLSLPDWVVGEGLAEGVRVAVRMPRWNARNRGGAPVQTMVFAAIVPVRSDKMVATLTLPRRAGGQGEQHVFAVALDGAER